MLSKLGLLVVGDALTIPLPAGVVNCVVTSPPYFSLRTYHGEQGRLWPAGEYRPMPGLPPMPVAAWQGSLGAEAHPEAYVWHMVAISREIGRVLARSGVYFLVVGDSYAGSGGLCTVPSLDNRGLEVPHYRSAFSDTDKTRDGIGPLDLIGIPYRLLFALQGDGWTVRSDIIWAKDSTKPEPRKGWRFDRAPCDCNKGRRETSITEQMEEQGLDRHLVYHKAGDIPFRANCPKCEGTGRVQGSPELYRGSWRPTRAHEIVLMLTKGAAYYADHLAIAEASGANPRDVIHPRRTNYSGKHFAVFPADLVRRLLQAGTPVRVCRGCGKPWAPVVDRGIDNVREWTLEYWPTCGCGAEWLLGLVLDPFMGSGTTGMVAGELGLRWIGVDLSRDYLEEHAKARALRQTSERNIRNLPLFGGT